MQTVERCDYISRKEELECDVLAVIVECKAQASAADVIEFVCDLSFFEDYALGREKTMLSEHLL